MKGIRIKIIFFFVAYLSFMALNTGMFWWNVVLLRDRLIIMDNFHELLSDILEIRRYEKNFMFYPEPGSFKEVVIYLDKAEKDATHLKSNIIEVAGQKEYDAFMTNMNNYKQQLRLLADGTPGDLAKTRKLGSDMLQKAQNLLILKKQRIHNALIRIQYIPIAVMISLAVLITVLFYWQTKKVFGRLRYVQQAAEGVARGDYDTINKIRSDDEISLLMRSAFSNMATELESRQQQLIESRKLISIGTLASGIAHELNNPLNNVSLTADTMLEEFDDLEESEAREMLHDIIGEIGRASLVVKSLLDFSREGEHMMSRISAGRLIRESSKLVSNQLKLDKIILQTDIPEDLPDIKGDLNSLQQVFINLIINADHAMEEGGTLKISASDTTEGYVRFDVSDEGCGMTDETIARIFDPFFTTKPVGKGTGLGLSIIYGIIKKHGGYIEVQSELGEGTTFSIYLPEHKEVENHNEQISGGSDR
ncbi:ATP-binding protein [Maridesulfovibrio sp.]|uniref:sensor histidine kinase n=1 Tax=Maridesulfovibrio sp. TaxID=2795000 RepID=UPI0029F52D9A|nr:ATP-binding protein [Maridesulfovibrio sp.]